MRSGESYRRPTLQRGIIALVRTTPVPFDSDALRANLATTAQEVVIPDRYLPPLLWYGVPATLEVPNPQDRATNPRWKRFNDELTRIHGRLSNVQAFGGMRRRSM